MIGFNGRKQGQMIPDETIPQFDVMRRALALQKKPRVNWSEARPCMTPNRVPPEAFISGNLAMLAGARGIEQAELTGRHGDSMRRGGTSEMYMPKDRYGG